MLYILMQILAGVAIGSHIQVQQIAIQQVMFGQAQQSAYNSLHQQNMHGFVTL